MAAGLLGRLALAAGGIAALTMPAGAGQPGERFRIEPADMPGPHATPTVGNGPQRVRRPPEAELNVPMGFRAMLYATRLEHPRNLLVAPNGDVFVAEQRSGKVTVLRDTDDDGRADVQQAFATGFTEPYGLALHGGALYVADTRAVWRLPYRDGLLESGGAPAQVTGRGAIGADNGHSTRNIVFSPDGSRLYVAIGSASNIGEEPLPRATIQEFTADGRHLGTFASGLRNPVGMAFYPGTDDLHVVVNERDGLGDGLVPDYLTRVERGGFYGWPYSYIGGHPQPGYAERRPDLVRQAIEPGLLFEAHSAPLGFTFYTGDQFPRQYREGAFVALHGSWNSSVPTGYKVVWVPFEQGRPLGYYENFITGFRLPGPQDQRARVWGRPSAVAVARDGGLLVSDDVGGTIWRVVFTDETPTAAQ